ncbi:MAG TPA: lipopolysaccharide kinase InaA family protein [Burkholderiales bacterium]|nr:lipopolysaccharide kinase InaA family protein [Burkholderiales bacterium]
MRRFEDFWNLEWNWVEPRNERRDGWSGASRTSVDTTDGRLSLFVKRQENHCYRSFTHPFRGRPTFYREWRNIQRLQRSGVQTLDPVYYGERMFEGRYQAVLVTIALDDFIDLDRFFENREQANDPQRALILDTVADLLLQMHRSGLRHNCLGGNHLMVRLLSSNQAEVRVLDLEKLKQTFDVPGSAAKDLARLIRHTPTLRAEEHQALITGYVKDLRAQDAQDLVKVLNQALEDKHLLRGRAAHPRIVVEETPTESPSGPRL